MQRLQYTLNQKLAPIEKGVMPRDIVGVNDHRAWYSLMNEVSDSRLPVPATTIDSHNPRSIVRARIENERNKVANWHDSPRSS
jgi:hypothetical protein